MPNSKFISFEMTELWGGGGGGGRVRTSPPGVYYPKDPMGNRVKTGFFFSAELYRISWTKNNTWKLLDLDIVRMICEDI